MRLERPIKSIEDGNQIRDQALDAAAPFFVTVALDALPVNDCPAFDTDGSNTVTVDELLTALNNALSGCP